MIKKDKLNKKRPIISLKKEEKIDEKGMNEEEFIHFAKKHKKKQSNDIPLEKYATISANHLKTERKKCKLLKKDGILTLNENVTVINCAGKKFRSNHLNNDYEFSNMKIDALIKSKTKLHENSKNNKNLQKMKHANLNNCDKNGNATKHKNKCEIMQIKDNKLDSILNESQNTHEAEDSTNDRGGIKMHKRNFKKYADKFTSNSSKLTKVYQKTNTLDSVKFGSKHSKCFFKKSTKNKNKDEFLNKDDLKVNNVNQDSFFNVNKRKAKFEDHCNNKKMKNINKNNLILDNYETQNKKEKSKKIYANRHDYSNNHLETNKSENIKEIKTINEIHAKNISINKSPFKRETEERLSRTLFVGNLPLDITTKGMKILFEKFGKIESVRQRGFVPLKPNMPKKVASIKKKYSPSIHSINGYVVFEKTEDAKKALALNGTLYHNHHIRVDQVVKKNNFNMKKAVFIGNLPFDIEEEKLWTHFGQCGHIKSVRIIRDKQTGLGKGFGYVLFEDENSVKKALRLQQVKAFFNRNLRIQPIKNIQECKSKLKLKSNQQYKIFKKKALQLRKKNNPKSKKTIKKMIKKQKCIYDKKRIASLFNK